MNLPLNNIRLLFSMLFFSFSIIYTCISVFSYSFAGGSFFSFLGIPKIHPVYADLQQLTHLSGCPVDTSDLFSDAYSYDPINRSFIYPPITICFLRLLGVNSSHTELIGLLFALLSISSILYFTFKLTMSRHAFYCVSSLFLLSFPFQLALERGNYDLFILSLFLFIPFLASITTCGNAFLAAILSFVVTAFKVYPAAGILPWSTVFFIRSKLSLTYLFIGFMSLAALIFQWNDIFYIIDNTPKPYGATSFGLLAAYQNRLGNDITICLISLKIIIIVLVTYFAKKLSMQPYFDKHRSDNFTYSIASSSAYLFSIMMLFVYILSQSYDYRLIFFLGILPFWINISFDSTMVTNSHREVLLLRRIFCFLLLFIGYEQYIPHKIGALCHFLSDIIIQPIIIGVIANYLFNGAIYSEKLKRSIG